MRCNIVNCLYDRLLFEILSLICEYGAARAVEIYCFLGSVTKMVIRWLLREAWFIHSHLRSTVGG
jgi:hypothetical protein